MNNDATYFFSSYLPRRFYWMLEKVLILSTVCRQRSCVGLCSRPIPTSGDIQITSDCVLYNQIVVTGSLNVTGVPDANGVLPKIIGGGSNRLFKGKRWKADGETLNLTGGRTRVGGAMALSGTVFAYDCTFHNNSGARGRNIRWWR